MYMNTVFNFFFVEKCPQRPPYDYQCYNGKYLSLTVFFFDSAYTLYNDQQQQHGGHDRNDYLAFPR